MGLLGCIEQAREALVTSLTVTTVCLMAGCGSQAGSTDIGYINAENLRVLATSSPEQQSDGAMSGFIDTASSDGPTGCLGLRAEDASVTVLSWPRGSELIEVDATPAVRTPDGRTFLYGDRLEVEGALMPSGDIERDQCSDVDEVWMVSGVEKSD